MDIKMLLLHSLSLKKPISGIKRICCGNSFFIIKYVINGKILSILNIKKERKRKTWPQRIKYYNRLYKISRNNRNRTVLRSVLDSVADDVHKTTKDVETETFSISPITKESETQSICVHCSQPKEIQTETFKIPAEANGISKHSAIVKSISSKNQLVCVTSTAQQTISSARFIRYTNLRKYSKHCQTDINGECKGVQCKRTIQIKATNTDVDTRDSRTQTENAWPTIEAPGGEAKVVAVPTKDLEIFIFMLNEIGDNIINQYEILNSNTEIMKQIMQINMTRSSKPTNRSCRSTSSQTVQLPINENKINSSQAIFTHKKPRKLIFFKGRKNSM